MDRAAAQQENEYLRTMWEQHPAEHLDTYLSAGVEDPRINIQSILTRAFLVDALFPRRFTGLIHEELRFGTVLTWLWLQFKAGANRDELRETLLTANAARLPAVVMGAARWLNLDSCPIPDYIEMALDPPTLDAPDQLLGNRALDVFCNIWQKELAELTTPSVRVLEPACGSANDYRAIHACGLARFLDYVGLDISEKNILNAKNRFQEVDFRAASILSTDLPDRSFDYVFAHDLLEHLSADGIETALSEMVRLTRREVWLHLFNSNPDGAHEIIPAELYHWNLLAHAALRDSGRALGCAVDVIEIASLLQHKFSFADHYNPRAATIVLKKQG